MRISRVTLVAAVCGSIASLAVAGPKDPKVAAGKDKAAKKGVPLMALNFGAKLEPVSYVRVRKMEDGRIVAMGPVMPYTPWQPSAGDAPTQNAFDIAQYDPITGVPVGGECAPCVPAAAGCRYWGGPAAINAHCVNDFVLDPAAVGKPIDRVDIGWNWGTGTLRQMWVGMFIHDTFNSCATGAPATAGFVDGVAWQFADQAGNGLGYFYANLGLTVPEGILAPADGNGAYEFLIGQYNTTTQQFTLDTFPGTQVMLWGKNSAGQLGTQTADHWDDDTPMDGIFGAGECYNYGGAFATCTFTSVGAMAGFWVDPAAGGGCFANCDGSTGTPLLTANDFQCFINKYAANDAYANCDGSTGTPALTANDFQCFINKYAAGCS